MSKMFLDPRQTLHTCKENNCEGCNVPNKLVCHFNGKQLALFLSLCIPPFLIAGYAFFTFNLYFFIGWLVFTFSWFGLWEIRILCSHCPHYAEPEVKSLKCWANYGSPKIWKYRPGPLKIMEHIAFISGFCIILLLPVAFFVIQKKYIFAIVFSAILIIWKLLLRKYYCSKCINFACTFSNVPKEVREEFFNKNPSVEKAWK